ncbi:MAG TPA: glutathione S-transferase [Gammaproteobacteria bacterium]|nr:glutathione S-transferase [Gammaproteobacteria bacterium]|tara:strand:+ start:176 stop:781 length:606 start_codon:yes stop_codon:yes gene_type:complete
MELRYSPTSPYVRKVCVVASETGLSGSIERVPTDPWDARTDLGVQNPLGKVPTLITDSGEVLFDSRVICEFLDGLHTGSKLFPNEPETRLVALRCQAVADGMLDAAVLAFIEGHRRPESARWQTWSERQRQVIHRGLNWLASRQDLLQERITIGSVAVGCALGYLDFRLADLNWQKQHTELARWYLEFSKRESMRESVPVG